MRKVLVLDIDGVLNNHQINQTSGCSSINPIIIDKFNRLVTELNIEIIIGSAWRYLILSGSMILQGFTNMMRTHGLSKEAKIIDILGSDQSEQTSDRGLLTQEWINKEIKKGLWNDSDRIVALDDMDLGYTEAGIALVKCKSDIGLTDEDVVKLIQIYYV